MPITWICKRVTIQELTAQAQAHLKTACAKFVPPRGLLSSPGLGELAASADAAQQAEGM